MELQPTDLRNEWVILQPLQEKDFETLFAVASDPLVWEQHPSRDRYQRPVFEKFFEGALESGGAFLIKDAVNQEVIGSSRFYDLDEVLRHVYIGYTFYARRCWGKPYNASGKKLMLDHAFQFVDKVFFSVGANNIRSQMAMLRIGAQKTAEEQIAYYGEQSNLNFQYLMTREAWQQQS